MNKIFRFLSRYVRWISNIFTFTNNGFIFHSYEKDTDTTEKEELLHLERIYNRKSSASGWSQFTIFDEPFILHNPNRSDKQE